MTQTPTMPPSYPFGSPLAPVQPGAYPPGHPAPQSLQLANPGVPITMDDGQVEVLRYTFASLAQIEQDFGSIKGIATGLKSAAQALQDDAPDDPLEVAERRAGMFLTLGKVLHAGLLHTGQPLHQILPRLDPAQLEQYLDAFARALEMAFGTLGNRQGETPQQETGPASSPGASGITSGLSSEAAAMPSGGA